MPTLTISGKAIGARRPLFADFSIPLSPDWNQEGGLTLRDLIARIVRGEVRAFQERRTERQVFRALTARQIEESVERGKVESGGSEVSVQQVDEGQAVAVACQAFEDGLFLVVIDEEDYAELDQPVFLQPDSRVTFVRLTLLAGG